MSRNVKTAILVVSVAAVVVAALVSFSLLSNRSAMTDAVLTAEAALISRSGAAMGTAAFSQQGDDEVLVAIDARGLTPGGHSVAIHEFGSCASDFAAAGDHFVADAAGWSFVHRNWKRAAKHGEHGGDLPNIYAHADGSARADFVTNGFTLAVEHNHSLFDDDGAAIVIHQEPQSYGAQETDTGARVACGVIMPN